MCNLLFEIEIFFFTTTFRRITQFISLWFAWSHILVTGPFLRDTRNVASVQEVFTAEMVMIYLAWFYGRSATECNAATLQGRGALFFCNAWLNTRDYLSFIYTGVTRLHVTEGVAASRSVVPHITLPISSAPVWFSLLLFHYCLKALNVRASDCETVPRKLLYRNELFLDLDLTRYFVWGLVYDARDFNYSLPSSLDPLSC